MTAARPRALFVAPMLPAAGGNGLAMRLGLFLEALARFADVDLAVIPVAGGAIARTPFLDAFGARVAIHHLAPDAGTQFRLLSRLADPAARLDAFKQYGRPSLASGLTPQLADAIAQLVARRRHDLVHVARAYMIPAGAGLPARLPVTLDLDEDDRSSFFSRAAFARRNGDAAGAAWLEQEGRACDDLLGANLDRFHRMFAAGRRDCLALMRRHPGAVIDPVANAVEIARRARRRDDGRTIVFVGSFGYPPNVDAIAWFVRSVMPGLRARVGRLRLLVAGANPPAAVRALGRRSDVRILGRVDDLGPLYRRATLAIAPMRGGGGTRIKILEAAAFGIPVVADQNSAAALFGRARPWGWVASHAADFVAACAEALRDGAERERRGRFGYNAVARSHARPAVVARLAQTLREACAPGARPRG
jgi:glycosyltransferase involved in cell wall biosynthesis